MVGKITGLSIALLLAAGLSVADEDAKKANKEAEKFKYLHGDFESYKNEKLTLTIDGEKKKFDVPENTPVGFVIGKDKTKVVKAKDNLKDVKKGSLVSLTLSLDGKKVLAVGVAELPKDKAKDDKEKEKKDQ